MTVECADRGIPRIRRIAASLWDVPAVAVIIALALWLDLSWLEVNRFPPVVDEVTHLDCLFLPRGAPPAPPAPSGGVPQRYDSPYPPLTHAVTEAAFVVLGRSVDAALQSLGFFVVVYVASMAWIGRSLGGARGSVTLAVVAAGTPWCFTFSHLYLLDHPLAAAVAFSFASLLASDGYRRRRPCVALGLGIGFGMLTKWTFPVYIAPPCLLALVPAWRRSRTAERRLTVLVLAEAAVTTLVLVTLVLRLLVTPYAVPYWLYALTLAAWAAALAVAVLPVRPGGLQCGGLRGFVIALACGQLIWLPWYFTHLHALARQALFYALASQHDRLPSMVSFHACLWDLSRLWWGAPILLVVGAVASFRSPALRWPALLALVGLVGGIAFMTFVWWTTARFMLALYPMATVVMVGWCARLRKGWLAVTAALAVMAVVQTAWWVPGIPPPPWLEELDLRGYVAGPSPRAGLLSAALPAATAPSRAPYPLLEILQASSRRGFRSVAVLEPVLGGVPDHGNPVRWEVLVMTAWSNGLALRVVPYRGRPDEVESLVTSGSDDDTEYGRDFELLQTWHYEGRRRCTIRLWRPLQRR